MKVEFVDCFLTTYDYYTIYIYLLFAAQDAVKRIIKKERKRARERARERERASDLLLTILYYITRSQSFPTALSLRGDALFLISI